MEFKELLARLAAFFTTWNTKYVPANQVNRLKIELIGAEVYYVFNGQILCSIKIFNNKQIQQTLRINPGGAEQEILLSILKTTRGFTTDPRLARVDDFAERKEIIILLLRLYHSLEAELMTCYPGTRQILNGGDFAAVDRQQSIADLEQFRRYLYNHVRIQEVPTRRIERQEVYTLTKWRSLSLN